MSAEQYEWIDATLHYSTVKIEYKNRELKTFGELWKENDIQVQAGGEGS